MSDRVRSVSRVCLDGPCVCRSPFVSRSSSPCLMLLVLKPSPALSTLLTTTTDGDPPTPIRMHALNLRRKGRARLRLAREVELKLGSFTPSSHLNANLTRLSFSRGRARKKEVKSPEIVPTDSGVSEAE